jgi:hypothetical protein
MKFLKNHPFAVEAFFDQSIVLTFAIPKEQLLGLIPDRLQLDTFQDKWAFVAIAMVQTSDLRPKGFPKFLGRDFFLIGYRIFVRYQSKTGRNLRGLYIIKSETDRKTMAFFGNIFTHYNYTTTDITSKVEGAIHTITSSHSKFSFSYLDVDKAVNIPPNSPFKDWKDARKFAGPLPHTFTYDHKENSVLIVKGVRQNWKPQPLKVNHYEFDYLHQLNLKNLVLANAFIIKNIPYHWKKGKIEKWT